MPWAERPSGAPSGSAFSERIARVVGPPREEAILAELARGNVPDFLRTFVEVELDPGGVCQAAAPTAAGPDAIWVLADYVSVGTDDDFLRVPMLPSTAQRLADSLDCLLPTTRIVDLCYRRATAKLPAIALEAGPMMIRSEGYRIHNERVEAARKKLGGKVGELTAGHKKDIVITNRLARGKLAIYGFYKEDGEPIQQLNLVHSTKYVDYAHGVRLVCGRMRLGGEIRRVVDVLRDPEAAKLLSSEGPMASPRYP